MKKTQTYIRRKKNLEERIVACTCDVVVYIENVE